MQTKTPTELKQTARRQAQVMKALAHPSRMLIIHALVNGERCVCELREVVEQDMSTVSRHLSVLKNAGLIAEEKRGLYVFYQLTTPCLPSFLHCVDSLSDRPEGCRTH